MTSEHDFSTGVLGSLNSGSKFVYYAVLFSMHRIAKIPDRNKCLETDQINSEDSENPDQAFFDKTLHAIEDLFERAKIRNEIHFAWALNPEVRGSQDAGWSTAHEAIRAFKDFSDLIPSLPDNSPIKVRVALAFYNHLAEGSGFYEIPKKMLLTIEGNDNNIMPFSSLVRPNARTGYISKDSSKCQ